MSNACFVGALLVYVLDEFVFLKSLWPKLFSMDNGDNKGLSTGGVAASG